MNGQPASLSAPLHYWFLILFEKEDIFLPSKTKWKWGGVEGKAPSLPSCCEHIADNANHQSMLEMLDVLVNSLYMKTQRNCISFPLFPLLHILSFPFSIRYLSGNTVFVSVIAQHPGAKYKPKLICTFKGEFPLQFAELQQWSMSI